MSMSMVPGVVFSLHNLTLSFSELRLVGGSNSCQGRLVTLINGFYGQACDLNADNNVARVVCRQLGCNPTGAQRVDPVQ